MGIIEEFTSPENAYLYNRWAPITPVVTFGVLYFLVQEAKISVNMFYLLLVYVTASYSAWTWGKSIKTQKEVTGGIKKR